MPGSLFERGWSMVMYEKGCIEGHTQSYVKLINAYCKKTGQEICSDTVNKYLAQFTKEEFESKLREFYDLPKTITPASILKAKDKNDNTVLTEYEEQKAFIKYLRDNKIKCASSGNGYALDTKNNVNYMAKLKATGLSVGFPDVQVFIGQGQTIFVEMKRKKGSVVSEKQKEWIDWLNNNGYIALISYGADEAIKFVKEKING